MLLHMDVWKNRTDFVHMKHEAVPGFIHEDDAAGF